VQLALRHDDVKVLEGLFDLPLRADKALASEVKVPVRRTLAAALAGGEAAKEVTLCGGERCVTQQCALILHACARRCTD
jgi:hypothetical protein